MIDISDLANDSWPALKLGSCESFLCEETLINPIDAYWHRVDQIIKFGSSNTLTQNDFLGGLLVLGVVSAAECYFRRILSFCIGICPLSRAAAAEKAVNLGGLLWHNTLDFSRSAFENYSLASAKDLSKVSRDFICFSLEDKDFKDALDAFDSVCQLRHGLVHNDAILPGKNAVALEVKRFSKPVRLVIRFAEMQEIAAIVNTLVLLYNRRLFAEMCERWAVRWRRRKDWEVGSEQEMLSQIYEVFCAKTSVLKVGYLVENSSAVCNELLRKKYFLP